MAATIYKYQIYCETEGIMKFVYGEVGNAPTQCPTDSGHTIHSNSIAIIGKKSNNISVPVCFRWERNNNPSTPFQTRDDSIPGKLLGYFAYNGTNNDDVLAKIIGVGSTDNNAGGQVIIRDGRTIVAQSDEFSTENINTPTIITFSNPTNLPEDPTVLEIFLRRNTGSNSSEVGIFSIQIYGTN